MSSGAVTRRDSQSEGLRFDTPPRFVIRSSHCPDDRCSGWPPCRRPYPHGGNTMLVLSRKVNEAIVIAGTVRVVVAGVRGASVRLGVQAPPDVAVDREEVHVRKQDLCRGPPDVFTQQEYDLLPDQLGCVPETFCGRQM